MWVLDIKPDNILVHWYFGEQDIPIIKHVALGDFDIALKVEGGRVLRGPGPIGNVLWRSPEGQTGKGVAKPSDVYSLALVVSDLPGSERLVLIFATSICMPLGERQS